MQLHLRGSEKAPLFWVETAKQDAFLVFTQPLPKSTPTATATSHGSMGPGHFLSHEKEDFQVLLVN
jgi:hypothetical protein